jgi:hypothetical protein
VLDCGLIAFDGECGIVPGGRRLVVADDGVAKHATDPVFSTFTRDQCALGQAASYTCADAHAAKATDDHAMGATYGARCSAGQHTGSGPYDAASIADRAYAAKSTT